MQSTIKVVVSQRKQESANVVALTLRRVGGGALPHWDAGAHIDVHVQDVTGNAAIRQYSLCGAVSQPQEVCQEWRIAVLDEGLAGRGGSHWLHQQALPGMELVVSEPRNNFRLHAGNAPAILVAGGIGITPMLSMAETLKSRNVDFSLHYFARSREALPFQDSPVVAQAQVSLDNQAHAAGLTLAERLSCTVTPSSHLYVCGPAGFMDAVIKVFLARGIAPERIHRELFAPAPTEELHADAAFEIELRSDGRVIFVPEGCSAVKALADAGIDVIVSCEQGLCGSCLTTVLEGVPEHRDQFLMPEERERNDCFTPCCSRAQTQRLVLDL